MIREFDEPIGLIYRNKCISIEYTKYGYPYAKCDEYKTAVHNTAFDALEEMKQLINEDVSYQNINKENYVASTHLNQHLVSIHKIKNDYYLKDYVTGDINKCYVEIKQ
jgi:hypothetical protein